MDFKLQDEDYIRLGDLLKVCSLVQSGGEAKQVILAGQTVKFRGQSIKVVAVTDNKA